MAADVMVPCVTRSSAASVLNMQYKQAFVYHKKRFQIPQLTHYLEIIEILKKTNIFMFWEIHSAQQHLYLLYLSWGPSQ